MTQKKTAPYAKKRPYRAPALRIHGDLKALTKAKGGNRTESGQPKTKPSGAP